jgi:exodeoxyribonuclease VII small subunit
MSNDKQPSTIPDFEEALKKLEAIVSQMEKADLSLDQALKQFEEGVGLARQCQQALTQAEQQVAVLIADPSEEV